MENQLFDLMTKMYNEMQEVKTKVNSMESKMNGMESKMATKEDIKDIRQDIVRLENKMDDKVSALFDAREVQTSSILKIEKNISSMQADISFIRQDVTIIANKEAETEKDVMSIKNHLKVVKQVYENM